MCACNAAAKKIGKACIVIGAKQDLICIAVTDGQCCEKWEFVLIAEKRSLKQEKKSANLVKKKQGCMR